MNTVKKSAEQMVKERMTLMKSKNLSPRFDEIPVELISLIPGYLSRKEDDIRELRKCVQEQRYDECKSLGHRLKGGGTSYGFPIISELGQSIQNAAIERDQQRLAELVEVFASFVGKTIPAFAQWEKSLPLK